jgi:hypothetical protein
MKMNRRNALIASAAFAAGLARTEFLTFCSANAAELPASNAKRFSEDLISRFAACQTACREITASCRFSEELGKLSAASQECHEICGAAGRFLSSQAGHSSCPQALLQACADACDRLHNLLPTAAPAFLRQDSMQSIVLCARSCRAAIV